MIEDEHTRRSDRGVPLPDEGTRVVARVVPGVEAPADDEATRLRTPASRGPATPPSSSSSVPIVPPGPSTRRARDPRLEPDDGHYGIRRTPLTEPVTRRPPAIEAPEVRPVPGAGSSPRRRGPSMAVVVTVVLAIVLLAAAAVVLAVLVAS